MQVVFLMLCFLLKCNRTVSLNSALPWRRNRRIFANCHHLGFSPHRSLFGSTSSSLSAEKSNPSLQLSVRSVEDMEDIGGLLASITLEDKATAGSVIFLQGDLGAGKTTFTRGFVRAATGDPDLCVTSPTYLLSNSYLSAADVR